MTVPFVRVLASARVVAKFVPDDAVGPLHLSVGVLVVGQADDEDWAHVLDQDTEHLASELGVVVTMWSTTSVSGQVGKAGAGPQAHIANDHHHLERWYPRLYINSWSDMICLNTYIK